jgi:hypothetical protein
MSLTVPSGGTSPSRSGPYRNGLYRAQPVEVDTSGAALAQFGQVLAQLGSTLERDRRTHAKNRAEVDSARGMNALAAQVGAIEDTYEAEQAWADGVERLRAEAHGAEGPYRLAGLDRDEFDLQFDALRDRHAAVLGPRFVAGRAEAQARDVAQMGEALAETWLGATGPARRAVAAQYEEFLARQVAEGDMPPAVAQATLAAWEDHVDQMDIAAAEVEDPDMPQPAPDPVMQVADRLRADPDLATLARLRGFDGLDPEQLAEMQALAADFDGMTPEDRAGVLAEERRRRAAALPRPMFQSGGTLDAAGLSQAAARLRAAWRRGDITEDQMIAQAELLEQWEDLIGA